MGRMLVGIVILEEFDDTIDQYDFDKRGYKSEWAKFTQGDPIIQDPHNTQDLNHYSYVWNNPYKSIDPNGKTVVTISGGPPSNSLRGADSFTEIESQFDKNLDIPVYNFKSGVSTQDVKTAIQNESSNQPVAIVGYSWGGGMPKDLQNTNFPLTSSQFP
ncbi:MAG: hypothetical protein KKC75_00020 [Nanoarchaeota archaeon]|nr:hypothetical protein [Nanoarchaeota archaeon]MBU1005687.1 hypothetical protein [Nanoarchaeota archaeon]MBU1946178.1 hypothetical protein [Nanoarchaeota archaeon]